MPSNEQYLVKKRVHEGLSEHVRYYNAKDSFEAKMVNASNFKAPSLGRRVYKTAIPIENFIETDCSRVITIPQITGTCWFNALLMALLYSERSRRFFYNNLICYGPTSVVKQNVINMFLNILARQYTKADKSKVQNIRNEFPTPDRILHVLHQADPQTFYMDPRGKEGHNGERYLTQLMKYFELNKKVLYCIYPNTQNQKNGPNGRKTIEDKDLGLYVHFNNIETKLTRYSRFGNKVVNPYPTDDIQVKRPYAFNGYAIELEKYYGSKFILEKMYGKDRNLSKMLSETATKWAKQNKTEQKWSMNYARQRNDTPLSEVNGVMRLPENPDARELYYDRGKLDKALTQIAQKAKKNWANIDVISVKIVENRRERGLNPVEFLRFTEGARVWEGQLTEEITVGGFIYKVDSMVITNLKAKSVKGCAHEIAGVTCNGKRYLYSGYLEDRSNIQSACPLMPFDWFSQNGDFCLNTYGCNLFPTFMLDTLANRGTADRRMCFNMKHSERTYLYVKEQSLNVDRVCGKLKRNVILKPKLNKKNISKNLQNQRAILERIEPLRMKLKVLVELERIENERKKRSNYLKSLVKEDVGQPKLVSFK
jgi:hypothetical protein